MSRQGVPHRSPQPPSFTSPAIERLRPCCDTCPCQIFLADLFWGSEIRQLGRAQLVVLFGAMRDLSQVSLRVSLYKCFGETPVGFDCIRKMNLIIGKNNSGKSALLDLIRLGADPGNPLDSAHNGQAGGALFFTEPVTEHQLEQVFKRNTSGGPLGINHLEYGKQWLGAPITWLTRGGRSYQFVSIDPPFDEQALGMGRQLGPIMGNPFNGSIFLRLAAERDIVPEKEMGHTEVRPSGVGATNLIQRYINQQTLPMDLIEKLVLSDLNWIVGQNAPFNRILVQQHDSGFGKYFLKREVSNALHCPTQEAASKLCCWCSCIFMSCPTCVKNLG